MGGVNTKPLAVFLDAPAETILCVGFSYTWKNTWRTGDSKVDFEGRFLEKSPAEGIGHNHFWRPGKGWERMVKPDGDFVYKIGSLVPLFITGPVPGDPKPKRTEDHINWDELGLDTDGIWGDSE